MSSFGNWLLKVKSKLPLNGDWLYVTATTTSGQPQQVDLAAKYDKPEKVLMSLKSKDIESTKLIYERSKAYESRIENIANLTRDKAKTLFGTTSLVSAVFFGVTSFFSFSSVNFPWYAVAVELIVFILLAFHLIRSLVISMEVMTREQSITASPDEFLDCYDNSAFSEATDCTPSVNVYKQAIAQTVAYSNQTHEYINERKNNLIMGQHAFKYALISFALLIVIHIFSILSYGNSRPTGNSAVAAEQQTKLLQSLISAHGEFLKGLNEGIKEMNRLQKIYNDILNKQTDLEAKIEELSKLVIASQQDKLIEQTFKNEEHP